MKFIRAQVLYSAVGLALGLLCAPGARAASSSAADDNAEPRSGEYRLTLFPYYKVTDKLTGFGYLGYVSNPDKHYTTDYLGWGVNWSVKPHVQLWTGLFGTYTNNENSADKLELRPFVGGKFFVANEIKWNIYNFTRLEFRDIQDRDTGDWSNHFRLRTRFGAEFPLAPVATAWQPKTWYGMADVEPFYRFDKNVIDPVRLRFGVAYIVTNRVRVEFIYHMAWTRPSGSSSLEYTDNIYRLNVKIALNKGMLQRVFDGGTADD